MAISDQIQNYNDGLLDAYDTVQTRGGTVPTNKNLVNLPDAIDSIPSGDISEYFIEKIQVGGTSGLSNGGWTQNIIKLPAFKINDDNDLTAAFRGYNLDAPFDFSGLDTSNVTNMRYMFYECSKQNLLDAMDLTQLDTSNVTNMSYMFNGSSISNPNVLQGVDTSSVTNMSYMFGNCSKLQDIDFRGVDLSKVTDMSFMFTSASKVNPNFTGVDTSSLINMDNMFAGGNASSPLLDLSSFDTSNVTNMRRVFQGHSGWLTIDVSNFNTSKCENFGGMFGDCSKMTTLDISNFDFSKVTGANNDHQFGMLTGMTALQNLTFGTNLGLGYTASANNSYAQVKLDGSKNLTHDSLMSVINNLADISSKNTQKLILGSNNLARLSSSEIAIATAKGWSVS